MRRTGVLSDKSSNVACDLSRPVPMDRNDLLVGRAAQNPLIYRPTPKDKWSRPRPSRAGFMGAVLEPLTGEAINEKYQDQIKNVNLQTQQSRAWRTAFPAALPVNPVPFGLNRQGRARIVPAHISADALDLLNTPAAINAVADAGARAYSRGAADANAVALANLGQQRAPFAEQQYQQEQAVQIFTARLMEDHDTLDPLRAEHYVRTHLGEFMHDQVNPEDLLDLEERAHKEMEARIDPMEYAAHRARWEAEVRAHGAGEPPQAEERPGEVAAQEGVMQEEAEEDVRQERAEAGIHRGAEADIASQQQQAAYSSVSARDERARARAQGASSSRPELSVGEYLQLRKTAELEIERGVEDPAEMWEEMRKIQHELNVIDPDKYARPQAHGYQYTQEDYDRHREEERRYEKVNPGRRAPQEYGGPYARERYREGRGPPPGQNIPERDRAALEAEILYEVPHQEGENV